MLIGGPVPSSKAKEGDAECTGAAKSDSSAEDFPSEDFKVTSKGDSRGSKLFSEVIEPCSSLCETGPNPEASLGCLVEGADTFPFCPPKVLDRDRPRLVVPEDEGGVIGWDDFEAGDGIALKMRATPFGYSITSGSLFIDECPKKSVMSPLPSRVVLRARLFVG